MRIIAGKHKSRKLNTLEGLNTRPMTDRMKESVFNTIGPYFDDDVVLDLFGGSGALSLESISRGASKAYIVEKNFEAANNIKVPYVIKDRRPGDIDACYADPKYAKEKLDWQATLGIEEMCKE